MMLILACNHTFDIGTLPLFLVLIVKDRAKVIKVVNIDNFLKLFFMSFRLMNIRDKNDDIFLKQLGKRIKDIRKEKGIKQVDLGYACDLDKSNMNRIEAGNTNPSILILLRICRELDITLSELFKF